MQFDMKFKLRGINFVIFFVDNSKVIMFIFKYISLKELVYLGGIDFVIVIVIVIDFRYGIKYSRIFNQELENVKKKLKIKKILK